VCRAVGGVAAYEAALGVFRRVLRDEAAAEAASLAAGGAEGGAAGDRDASPAASNPAVAELIARHGPLTVARLAQIASLEA